ncbi:hypothetical protein M407DRAFT_26179 [Tulasnella calospora MUT 4182]|uniref:Uncharacterized protein n=1 Tax=Tulasnella calospora MUT 4182 TaxID=1051891 RepID=A0A0C3Q5F2_9AGAM|nr:hypothetical protein M407DRAFT_26179 [Tulasnella calospora MUT 4182]
METLSNRARLIAIMQLGLFVPRMVLDLRINQEQVDDLITRVPHILEIYEKAIQSQDPLPRGGLVALRLPLLLLLGHLAQPATITIIDESLTRLQSNFDTMTWLVFAPFFQERETLDRGHVFHIHNGGNILRSYDESNTNASTGIISEAISRFGASRMVQRSILLCKTTGASDRDLMLGPRVLVLNLLEDRRFHEPFILRRRVHRILVNRFWDCTRKRVIVKHDTLIEETFEIVRALERILKYLPTDKLREVMIQDLVMGQDLLPLIARVLLPPEEQAWYAKTVRVLMDTVAPHCRQQPSQFRSLLQRDWLYGSHCLQPYVSPGQVTSHFGTGNPSQPANSIDMWNEFGARLLGVRPPGLSTHHPVSDEDRERLLAPNASVLYSLPAGHVLQPSVPEKGLERGKASRSLQIASVGWA